MTEKTLVIFINIITDTTTELELNPDGTVKNKETQLFGDDEYVVNIGPQHPATHGLMAMLRASGVVTAATLLMGTMLP